MTILTDEHTAVTKARVAMLEEMFLESIKQGYRDRLLELAKLIVDEGTRTGASTHDYRGLRAAHLFPLVLPKANEGLYLVFDDVWKFLADTVLVGWREGIVASAEKELRRAVLSLSAPTKELEKVLETIARETFALCKRPDRLYRLLADVDDTSNHVVVLKAAQTAAVNMHPKATAYMFACWDVVQQNLKSLPSWAEFPGALDSMRELALESIDDICKVHAVAYKLREQLPEGFRQEGGTDIRIYGGGRTVKFIHKVRQRDAQDEKYIDSLLQGGSRAIANSRPNLAAPKFRIEVFVQLMPSSWQPGEHATAVQTFHRMID